MTTNDTDTGGRPNHWPEWSVEERTLWLELREAEAQYNRDVDALTALFTTEDQRQAYNHADTALAATWVLRGALTLARIKRFLPQHAELIDLTAGPESGDWQHAEAEPAE